MASKAATRKKRRRLLMRRKRTLDPSIVIDYRKPDTLKRFITDRGKIIPRRISGATAAQQRAITTAIKQARYLALLPYSVAHRTERGFAGEMSAANTSMGFRDSRPPRGPGGPRGDRDSRDRGPGRSEGGQERSDFRSEPKADRNEV